MTLIPLFFNLLQAALAGMLLEFGLGFPWGPLGFLAVGLPMWRLWLSVAAGRLSPRPADLPWLVYPATALEASLLSFWTYFGLSLCAVFCAQIVTFSPGADSWQWLLLGSLFFVLAQDLSAWLLPRFPRAHLRVFLPLLGLATLGLALQRSVLGGMLGSLPLLLTLLLWGLLCHLGSLELLLRLQKPTRSPFQAGWPLLLAELGLPLGLGWGLWLSRDLGPTPLLIHVGMWVLLGALALLPLWLFWRSSPQHLRAEHWFPFMGLLTLPKIYRKHAAPLEQPLAREQGAHWQNLRIEPWTASISTPAKPAKKGAKKSKHLKLLFSGDLCPKPPQYYHFSEVLSEFILSHDLRLANLEGPQTLAEYGAETGLKSALHAIPDRQWEALYHHQQPLFNRLVFVNNHALDQGRAAYDQTLERFEQRGLPLVTSQPQIFRVNGLRLGLMALTFGSNCFWRRHAQLRSLKPETLLQNRPLRERFLQEIQALREKVDFLILSYHWGYESEYWPAPLQQACFQLLAEAGVDLLYGHHAHIVQPFELQNEDRKLCLYSCGNLLSGMPLPVYQQGVLYSVSVQISRSGPRFDSVEPIFFAPEGTQLQRMEQEQTAVWQQGKPLLLHTEMGKSQSMAHEMRDGNTTGTASDSTKDSAHANGI